MKKRYKGKNREKEEGVHKERKRKTEKTKEKKDRENARNKKKERTRETTPIKKNPLCNVNRVHEIVCILQGNENKAVALNCTKRNAIEWTLRE